MYKMYKRMGALFVQILSHNWTGITSMAQLVYHPRDNYLVCSCPPQYEDCDFLLPLPCFTGGCSIHKHADTTLNNVCLFGTVLRTEFRALDTVSKRSTAKLIPKPWLCFQGLFIHCLSNIPKHLLLSIMICSIHLTHVGGLHTTWRCFASSSSSCVF